MQFVVPGRWRLQKLEFKVVPPKPKIPRGCKHCPLSDKPKVIGLRRIAGHKIFVWGQGPGAQEEFHKKELVGPSGKMFWQEFAAFGVTREMCDVQNVTRCRTTQIIKTPWGEKKIVDRAPDKLELHCCSIYTEKALELQGGKALVHVVLGRVAAKALLRGEYRKSLSSFYSKKLQAHVICIYHPSYFLRGGNRTKLKEFRAGLRAAAQIALGTGERFEYVRSMDYKIVRPRDLPELCREIAEVSKTKIISADIEDGFIPETGEKVLVCIGFSWKPGMARIVPFRHIELRHWTQTVLDYIKKFYEWVMGNLRIRKSFHHGSYDVLKSKSLAGINTQGYAWDTNYSEYITNPGYHAYGIGAIADRRYPEMSGYWNILQPYIPEDREYPNFYEVPLDALRLYNGGDCDIGKRIQLSTQKTTPAPLMRVFINCGFVIDRMENNGPLFDFEHCKFVESWLPKKIAALLAEIRFIVGEPDFKVTPARVSDVLYKKLRLNRHLSPEWFKQNKNKLNTNKETLELLSMYHKLPKKITEYRALSKKASTWLVGFKNSAEMHGGRVRTIWWLTGTVTCRLRSGGKKKLDDTKALGIVNLQNIAGDPTIENLMVSDLNWRDILKKWACGILEYRSRVYCAFDYSQLEIRVLAQLSRDPLLVQYLKAGVDIHSAVGHELTGFPIDKIKKDRSMRTAMKQLHFGIVYGLSAESLFDDMRSKFSEQGVEFTYTREQVAKLHGGYFKKFKGVEIFMNKQAHDADTIGRVMGLFGMGRDISASDMDRSTYYINQARNTPIQMTAHQLVLIALSAYHLNPKRYAILHDINMEIHDSLWFGSELRFLQRAFAIGKYLLTTETLNYVKKEWPDVVWDIPLAVECKAGYRLGVVLEYNGESPEQFMKKWVVKNAEVEAKTLADAKI